MKKNYVTYRHKNEEVLLFGELEREGKGMGQVHFIVNNERSESVIFSCFCLLTVRGEGGNILTDRNLL